MAKSVIGRVLRWIGYLVAAVLVIYLVGANLILNTKILDPVINKKPEKTLVEWSSGWTIWPGFIHVEGLRVRGQSKGQQWQFRLEVADVRMALLPLTQKTIRARRVRGSDFHFRQRPRLTPETAGAAETAHYPEIEGLSNPPEVAPEILYPKKKKKKKPGWHIDASDILLSDSIELWVGELKITGEGTAGGDFEYQIPKEMHLAQAFFGLSNGEVAIRGTTFVNQLDISLDASLGPFVPNETKGLDIFNYLLGSFALENGTIPDVEVINALMPPTNTITFDDGTASFSWAFNKTSVEEGSTGSIQIVGENTTLLMGGKNVDGDFSLTSAINKGSLAQGEWLLGETTLAFENIDIRLLRVDEEGDLEAEPTDDDLWWSRFNLRAAALNLGDPQALRADFDFRMKNTEPLIHLLLAKETDEGEGKLPFWAKMIPDIEDVQGRGSIEAQGEDSVVRDVVIDGDILDFTAWMQKQGEVTNGKLYLRVGGHGVGLHVKNNKRDLKILRPRKWALEQPELDHQVILEGDDSQEKKDD